jgi:hypothetical protein
MRLVLQYRHVAEYRAGLGDPGDVPAVLDHVDRALKQKQQPARPAALGQHEVAFLEGADWKAGQSFEDRL